MDGLRSLDDLLASELQELRAVERAGQRLLARLEQAAAATELRDAVRVHRQESRSHQRRIEEALERLGRPVERDRDSIAVAGLAAEGDRLLAEAPEPVVRDAAIIATLQKLEHYEIASYGCAVTYAEMLGHDAVRDLVGRALGDEEAMEEKLAALAGHLINPGAEGEAGFRPGF